MRRGAPRRGVAPDVALRALEERAQQIRERFVVKHEQTLASDAAMELDLDAAAVLFHAELERFFEEVAQWVLNSVVARWTDPTRPGRPSLGILGLCLHFPFKDSQQAEEGLLGKETALFDKTRSALESAKRRMSEQIQSNNGVALEYLRPLFEPLGIPVPPEPHLRSSLEQLARIRGGRAHGESDQARVVVAPEKLGECLSDCVELARLLATRATEIGAEASN